MSDINDSEISNESSDVFELSYDGSLCTNTKEMELEELRLEEKSSKEHNADIKHIRENQTKERKEKALKSMCDLLNLSKKYSNYYCKTFSQECNKYVGVLWILWCFIDCFFFVVMLIRRPKVA